MDNQLFTLSKIFTERLFRIPDYQRGYAWTERQLKDFWNDISQLEPGRNHYTGVLTLENVPPPTYSRWDEDEWIVKDKSYQPFYVVDGQQRLTTSIILVQVIIESMEEGEKLNHNDKTEIQKKFLFDSKDNGISRSYIFGYEKDNPSYEFLKAEIFKERITSGGLQETVYTKNLENAKSFFIEKVAELIVAEREHLFKKLTQSLLFNIFTISEDVDVCVAFETMNNRGKPLSYLELLKNRLIYLSYKLPEMESERQRLRSSINDCWRSIYHNLGKNKDYPLDDDRFLLTHYLVYFGKSLIDEGLAGEDYSKYRRLIRVMSSDYPRALLERTFISKNISDGSDKNKNIDLKFIFSYVSSLQEAVECWYKIFNPQDSTLSDDVKIWTDKLNRLGMEPYLPLLLVFFQKVTDEKRLLTFLQAVERHLFLISLGSVSYRHIGVSFGSYPEALVLATEMWNEKNSNISADRVIKSIHESINGLLKSENYIKIVSSNFRSGGFYAWDTLRYFLFEYELSLQALTKTGRRKINWAEFVEDIKDFVTVEHIYPQQARAPYWVSRFKSYTQKQKTVLRNSLGNLLPLSKPKNSTLSNKPYPDKAFSKSDAYVSYQYGSFSEIEVSMSADWGPTEIKGRGIKLLQFLEKRWSVPLGDDKAKVRILGLEFI